MQGYGCDAKEYGRRAKILNSFYSRLGRLLIELTTSRLKGEGGIKKAKGRYEFEVMRERG